MRKQRSAENGNILKMHMYFHEIQDDTAENHKYIFEASVCEVRIMRSSLTKGLRK